MVKMYRFRYCVYLKLLGRCNVTVFNCNMLNVKVCCRCAVTLQIPRYTVVPINSYSTITNGEG